MEDPPNRCENNCTHFTHDNNSYTDLNTTDNIVQNIDVPNNIVEPLISFNLNHKMSTTFYQQNIYQFYNSNFFYSSFHSGGDKFEDTVGNQVYGDFKSDEIFQADKEDKGLVDLNCNWSQLTTANGYGGNSYLRNEEYNRFGTGNMYDGYSGSDQSQHKFPRTKESKFRRAS